MSEQQQPALSGDEAYGEVDDSTVVVSKSAFEVEDATVVVAKPAPAPEQEPVFEDATVVVAKSAPEPESEPEPEPELEDATLVVAKQGTETGAHGRRTQPRTKSSVAPPIELPTEDLAEIPPSLAKLFFKKPLDPKRRAPEAPFPNPQSSLPRAGVGVGIPVVYGARPEELPAQSGNTELSRMIGSPPLGYDLPPADRSALASTALVNRKFRLLALGGGAGVLVVSIAGLWWVATQLLPF